MLERGSEMTEIERFRRVILRVHRCDSFHVRSEPVQVTVGGQSVSGGRVEVFALKGHPKVSLAYAWRHETEDGKRRYVAVLGMDPIKSPLDAVRFAIAQAQPQR